MHYNWDSHIQNVHLGRFTVVIMSYSSGSHNPLNSFLASHNLSSADNLCKQFGPRSGQNVGPDLDPNCLTLWWYSWKNFLKMFILKKISRRQQSMKNSPACKELNTISDHISDNMLPQQSMKNSAACKELNTISDHISDNMLPQQSMKNSAACKELNTISDHISDNMLPQMKALNIVIP